MTRTQAVLIGGVFNGVLSALPIIDVGNCCCLWVIGGGVVTAWLLQREQSDPLDLGEGALGGLLAGVVGAAVYAVVSLPVQMVMGSLGMFEVGELDVPPEIREFIEAFSSSVALRVLVGSVMMLILGAIFSTLGGLVGAFFFRRTVPPAAPGGTDIVPPPPPPIA